MASEPQDASHTVLRTDLRRTNYTPINGIGRWVQHGVVQQAQLKRLTLL
ncbi:MAG: hypothetical protein ACXWCX_08760 [Burkholderiales bacterium]